MAKNITATTCGIAPHSSKSFMTVETVFTAIATFAVLLRFLAKCFGNMKLWWDDPLIILALLASIAYTVLGWFLANIGFGSDIWTVHAEDIPILLKGFYTGFIIYGFARFFVRTSILLFYLRIFSIPLARPLIIASLALDAAIAIVVVTTMSFQCTPVSYYWTQYEDGEHTGFCVSRLAITWTAAILSIAFDLWIILLPLPFVVRLKLSWQKRVVVSIMFAVGVCVLIISFIRLPTISKFIYSTNQTVDTVPLAMWTGVEMNVAIICACLPSLRVLLGPALGRWADTGKSVLRRGGRGSDLTALGANSWEVKRHHYYLSTPGSSSEVQTAQASDSETTSKIRMTTTILQTASSLPASRSELPLDDLRAPGAVKQGFMNAQAWAE